MIPWWSFEVAQAAPLWLTVEPTVAPPVPPVMHTVTARLLLISDGIAKSRSSVCDWLLSVNELLESIDQWTWLERRNLFQHDCSVWKPKEFIIWIFNGKKKYFFMWWKKWIINDWTWLQRYCLNLRCFLQCLPLNHGSASWRLSAVGAARFFPSASERHSICLVAGPSRGWWRQ